MQQERFRVFISHKHADAALASVVGRQLERLSPHVESWVSGEDLVAGGDWNRAIKKALADSHMLVLLFTTPARNWDWCLYEAGLFTRFGEDDVSSVVCLYDPKGQPPRPLSNLQGVRADETTLAKFLGRLFKETWRVADDWKRGPLAPRLGRARIDKAAARIASEFDEAMGNNPTVGDLAYYPCHRVVLDFGPHNGRSWDRIPDNAVVVEGADATSAYTLSLFGVAEGSRERTWGDLVEAVGDGRAQWRADLDAAFTLSLEEQLFPGTQEPFKAWDRREGGRREYRPMIYRVLRSGPRRTPVGLTIVLDPVPG